MAVDEKQKEVALDFMDAVVSAIDGERDPRCLISSLGLVKMLFSHYHHLIHYFANKIFDSVACYFPITFVPPPDDPHGITTEALVRLLEECLCGHELMLDRLIPFIKDKLNTDTFQGKIQALSCLARVCCQYGPVMLLPHDPEVIADTLFEVVQASSGSDQDVIELRQNALRCIECIALESTRDETAARREGWKSLIEPILRHAERNTKSPQDCTSLSGKAAIKVACAVSRGSYVASKAVCDRLLPVLIGHIPINTVTNSDITHLPSLLSGIKSLIEAMSETTGVTFSGMGTMHPLAKHGPPLLKVLTGLLYGDKFSALGRATDAPLPRGAIVCIRECLCCVKALFFQASPEMLELTSEGMSSFISCITDFAIYGEMSMLGTRIGPIDWYSSMPSQVDSAYLQSTISGDELIVDADPHAKGSDGCSGSGSHPDDARNDTMNVVDATHVDTLWRKRLAKQEEQVENDNDVASARSFSLHLKEAALEILCQVSVVGYDEIILPRVQAPIREVMMSTLPHGKTLETYVGVLSSIANACRYGKDQQQLFLSFLDPLVAMLIIVLGAKDNYFVEDQLAILLKGIQTAVSGKPQKIKCLTGWGVDSGDTLSLHCIIRKFSESEQVPTHVMTNFLDLLYECGDHLPEESQESFHTSVLTYLKTKSAKDLSLVDIVSITSTIAVLPLSSSQFEEESDLSIFILDFSSYIQAEAQSIPLTLFESYVELTTLFINKAAGSVSTRLTTLTAETCLCLLNLKAGALGDHLCSVCSKFLIWLCRGVFMRPNTLLDHFPQTIRRHLEIDVSRIESITSWHDVMTAILLQSITKSEYRDYVAIKSIQLVTDTNSIWRKSNMTVLWKQKLWSSLFKEIQREMKLTDESSDHLNNVSTLLLTMCSIINCMPPTIISANSSTICSVSVRALTSSSDNSSVTTKLKALAIENLCKFSECLKEKIVSHLTAVGPACVSIALTESIAKSRRLALEYLLDICTSYPYHQIFPIKKLVIKGLQLALDDKKRAVRLLAAKVRNEWCVVGNT